MAIVTLDAPLPRILPQGLTTLVPALHPYAHTQAGLFLLRLHQMGNGKELVVGENLHGVGDSEWPYELHTYAWTTAHGWICLAWPDHTVALGQPHADGGWSFFPAPFQFHPYVASGDTTLGLFETHPDVRADLLRLQHFQRPPLTAERWGTPWISGSPSPVAVQAFLSFLRKAVEAVGLELDPNVTVLLTGSVGLGAGRWIAPDLIVDFRTHPRGEAWDDLRCVLAHRPPFTPSALINHAPYWMGGPPKTLEQDAVSVLVFHNDASAHERMAFRQQWDRRLAEARDLQDRGLCRPDTLVHPDEDL
jgi:hypothetical protein